MNMMKHILELQEKYEENTMMTQTYIDEYFIDESSMEEIMLPL